MGMLFLYFLVQEFIKDCILGGSIGVPPIVVNKNGRFSCKVLTKETAVGSPSIQIRGRFSVIAVLSCRVIRQIQCFAHNLHAAAGTNAIGSGSHHRLGIG